MKERGQRQDVAFLALAVAVLAIGVALFVGFRAFPRRTPAPAPKPESKAKPVTTASLQTKPQMPASHDPFQGKVTKEVTAPPGPPKPKAEEIKLVGIIRGREPLAVIREGDRRYYSKRGARVGPYTLVEIGRDRAVLARGAERVTLTLGAPDVNVAVGRSG
jgi:hypothetical protein